MKAKFVLAQIPGEHHRIGVIPPQAAVLPVTTQILPCSRLYTFPATLDVIRASRTMDQSKRRPDRMIASKYKTVSGASQDCPHSAPVCLNPRCLWIIKAAAVYSSPEIPV